MTKKQIKITTIIIILMILGIFSFLSLNKQPSSQQSINIENVDLSKIRPEIKIYIDELYNSYITSIVHTTDGIENEKKQLPKPPKSFSAGRYKVVFNNMNNNDKKVIIFQTEETVGHMSEVIPGKTNIGGYVEIQKHPEKDKSEGIAHTTKSIDNQEKLNSFISLKLNEAELDYFIQTIYQKFDKPLEKSQAEYLDEIKDYALAIMFSNKSGINEYHDYLIDKIKK